MVLKGKLQKGVTGKDVIIALSGYFNRDEVLNHIVEFHGEGVKALSLEQRLTVANMTTEWGALGGVFPIDEITFDCLRKRADMGYYGGRYSPMPIDVENEKEDIPTKFALYQNYPNPFNPTTTIKYSIPNIDGIETLHVTSLRIYNILGEEIATLVNEKQSPGNYSVTFDASNLASGVYFYTLRVGSFVATKKMILLK